MIITLTGKVTHKGGNFVVLEVAGVGYQVQVGKPSLMALPVGSDTKLWTHEYIREDSRDLYGFLTTADHDLFIRLIEVSGVGPKAAMAILELGGAGQVESAVEKGNVEFLSGASGVGKKTAQKIILELQGKLVSDVSGSGNEEVLIALVSLGYNREAARDALGRIGAEGTVEEKLRAALRELGR